MRCKGLPASLGLGFGGEFLADPILEAGEVAGGAQAGAALELRAGGEAGILLVVSQGAAVFPGGGGEAGARAALLGGARVVGFGVEAPAQLAAHGIPDVTAAATAFGPSAQDWITAFAGGVAKRARNTLGSVANALPRYSHMAKVGDSVAGPARGDACRPQLTIPQDAGTHNWLCGPPVFSGCT